MPSPQARARRALAERLHGKGSTKFKKATDEYYAACLTLRAEPVPAFLLDGPSKWVLPITSMNEERLLKLLGLPKADRNQIEGLRTGRIVVDGQRNALELLTEAQLAARAINRFAGDPLPEVGSMQRRTAHKLLRPYPHGMAPVRDRTPDSILALGARRTHLFHRAAAPLLSPLIRWYRFEIFWKEYEPASCMACWRTERRAQHEQRKPPFWNSSPGAKYRPHPPPSPFHPSPLCRMTFPFSFTLRSSSIRPAMCSNRARCA